MLGMEIPKQWDDAVKKQHLENRDKITLGLTKEFGIQDFEQKKKNFVDLGNAFPSVVAFHNIFFRQCRRAFVMGAYYPALTGITTLTERVLNHLIFLLRDSFTSTLEYKEVRGGSIVDWDKLTRILEAWDCLLPESKKPIKELKKLRHRYAAHFNPVTDTKDRELALEGMQAFQELIRIQFGSMGKQPWFISGTKGEFFIKRDHERHPFVRNIYIPNSVLVGPNFTLEYAPTGWLVRDEMRYEKREITDKEFMDLRDKFKGK